MTITTYSQVTVAVIIPSYRVKKQILSVIEKIGESVQSIIVVDDACPEHTGEFVKSECKDPRVTVVFHPQNQGVGGAMISGFKKALELNADIVVKVDGDGQMNPQLIPKLIAPLIEKRADYVKGNRFFNLYSLTEMPTVRLIGNASLSFISKLSSGYYQIMDPTNGFIAIEQSVLKALPLDKIAKDYFFESDLLFRLNISRAVVLDLPMDAHYGEEKSNLKITRIIFPFFRRHMKNLLKRIFYNYFLRDFSVASVELVLSIMFIGFGFIFGAYHWMENMQNQTSTPTGTVMISTLTIILGFQLFLSFLTHDMSNVPLKPLSKEL